MTTVDGPSDMNALYARLHANGVEQGRIEGEQACIAGHDEIVRSVSGDLYQTGWGDGYDAGVADGRRQGALWALAGWGLAWCVVWWCRERWGR